MFLQTAEDYYFENVEILWRVQGWLVALWRRTWLDWKRYSSWRDSDKVSSSSFVKLFPIYWFYYSVNYQIWTPSNFKILSIFAISPRDKNRTSTNIFNSIEPINWSLFWNHLAFSNPPPLPLLLLGNRVWGFPSCPSFLLLSFALCWGWTLWPPR